MLLPSLHRLPFALSKLPVIVMGGQSLRGMIHQRIADVRADSQFCKTGLKCSSEIMEAQGLAEVGTVLRLVRVLQLHDLGIDSFLVRWKPVNAVPGPTEDERTIHLPLALSGSCSRQAATAVPYAFFCFWSTARDHPSGIGAVQVQEFLMAHPRHF